MVAEDTYAEIIDPVRTSYDAVAEPYAASFVDELAQKPLDRGLIDAFAELAAPDAGAPIADVGCGPGYAVAYLAARGRPVVGLDLAPAMVALARERHPGTDVREGSILSLPLPDASVSGVLSLYSIIHLPRAVVPVALAEFRRVLRPGGVLLLAFHVGETPIELDEWFGRPVTLVGHLFDPAEVTAGLEAVGLRVDAHVARHPDPAIEVPTERAYLLARLPHD